MCSTSEETKVSSEKQDVDTSNAKFETQLETLQLGVFRVLIKKRNQSFFNVNLNTLYDRLLSHTKLMRRLVTDVAHLAPGTLFLMTLASIWESVQNVFLLNLETKILHIIETGLSDGGVDGYALMMAICSRLIFVVCTGIIGHWSNDLGLEVKRKVDEHFDHFLLTKNLATDLPTAQANRRDENISSRVPWAAFQTIFELLSKLLGVLSALAFVVYIARSGNHGPIFGLLCIGQPIVCLLSHHYLWNMSRVIQANNEDYIRMNSLWALEGKGYRMEVITGNIAQYILQEFRKSRDALKDTSIEDVDSLYGKQKSPLPQCIANVVGDFPMLYYGTVAFLNPSSMSLTTVATLQQASTLLQWSFVKIFEKIEHLRYYMSRVQQLYDLENASVAIKDGDLSYPTSQTSDKGMALEFRNVSFTYPGSKGSTKALDDVSFRFEPGELVVVVGANGSGKSTFIKLVTRLYDVDSGQVLVDGENVQDYKLVELRQGIATLTQDHRLYPLSIQENIGLGYPEAIDNVDLIKDAARRAGAEGLIEKLRKGLGTVLDPYMCQYGVDVDEEDDSELAEELKKLNQSADVSGGERQRVVAARTFMRFNSDKVRFVAVDEPSSALDPEGELALFNNLREVRKGKTMVFVTHRFGHLTRHADKILCMKDGKIAESGSHTELVELRGEYSKLYNIQAKAFESGQEE